jgi:hypothetical protein
MHKKWTGGGMDRRESEWMGMEEKVTLLRRYGLRDISSPRASSPAISRDP